MIQKVLVVLSSPLLSRALASPPPPPPPPPSFAPDFTSTTQTDVFLKQGESKATPGGACCAADSPGCQLQGMFSRDLVEEQGSMNRTRSKTMCSGGPCIVASLYGGGVDKQMMLAPGAAHNSTHEFVCAEFCPLSGDFVSSVQIGHADNQSGPVTYQGRATVSQEEGSSAKAKAKTETCDRYRWSEMLFHVVPVQTTDFYVYTGGAEPAPFFSSVSILNGVAPVSFNSSFLGFRAANLTGRFDIDPASIQSCPMSPGCSGREDGRRALNRFGGGASLLRSKLFSRPPRRRSVSSSASSASASSSKASGNTNDGTTRQWSDYSCKEDTAMLSNSGGVFRGDDVCCTPATTTTVNGECLVTRSRKRGMHYVDAQNHRERYEDEISGETRVIVYGKPGANRTKTTLKDMLINVSADGTETCQEYCPLLDGETLEPLALGANHTDEGAAVVDGQHVEHFRWSIFDEIPIVHKQVKVAQVEFFVTHTDTDADADTPAASAVPVFSETRLINGGVQTGSQNTTYSGWVQGVPPASKFDIAGVATCPQAKNCQIEN
jgi:hypothetical protein